MKNKAKTIIAGAVAGSLMIMLITMMTLPVYAAAGTPSQPHNADAIWVEPSTMTIGHSMIGTEFNITVAMNLTETIFSYQFALYYNRTLLEGMAAGYTDGATSYYFAGHITTSPPPEIDTGDTGNGSVLAFEALEGSDSSTGHAATLAWIEFKVLSFTVPTGSNMTVKLDVSKDNVLSGNTWWEDLSGNFNVFANETTADNGTITFVPEFSYLLILPIFLTLTLAAMIVSKRLPRKNLK